jgi:hypothetical protein
MSWWSVANLALSNPTIVGQYYVWAFAWAAIWSSLTNVSVTNGYVRALHGVFAWGIVWLWMFSEMQQCYVSWKIRGSWVFIGWVAWYLAGSSVSWCSVYADVDGGYAVWWVAWISDESTIDQASVYGAIVWWDLNLSWDNWDNYYWSENLYKMEEMCIWWIVGSDGGWFFMWQADDASIITSGNFFWTIVDNTYLATAITWDQIWCPFVYDEEEYEPVFPDTTNSVLIDDFESYNSGAGLWTGDWWYGYTEYSGGWPYGEEPSDTYWIADCSVSYEGECSSKAISYYGDNTIAETTKTINFSTSGYVGFWVKTSSEESWDGVSFWINGINQQMGLDLCEMNLDAKWWLTLLGSERLYGSGEEIWSCPFYLVSGETDRRFYSFPISSGENIITFLYTKDSSGSLWEDTAWVDEVTFYYNIGEEEEEEPTPPTGGWGGSISADYCPNGDSSWSYYDGECDGNNPQTKPNPVKLPKLKLNQIEKKKPIEFCKYNDTKWVSAAFTDIVWTPYASAVWVLVSHCLVQWYNNNGQEFGINSPLKRGELYKVFTRMALLDFDLNTPGLGWSHGYKIVGETVWLWNLLNMDKDQSALVTQQELLQVTMNYLAYMWVLDEAPAFTFWNNQVTRGEFAKFINTVLGLVSTK